MSRQIKEKHFGVFNADNFEHRFIARGSCIPGVELLAV
jgi:hypothetical protein